MYHHKPYDFESYSSSESSLRGHTVPHFCMSVGETLSAHAYSLIKVFFRSSMHDMTESACGLLKNYHLFWLTGLGCTQAFCSCGVAGLLCWCSGTYRRVACLLRSTASRQPQVTVVVAGCYPRVCAISTRDQT